MKKIIILSVVAVLFGLAFANVASAKTIITDNGDGTFTTTFIPEDGFNPMNLTMPWGKTGANTPVVKSGSVTKDEAGEESKCPAWYQSGCFDLSRTDYYRNQMIELARQVKANGMLSQFPHLTYWAILAGLNR